MKYLLQRPHLGVPQSLHSVILPNSLTVVLLNVAGWGWLRVRSNTIQNKLPVPRGFIHGRKTLQLTVRVGDTVTVSAANAWGIARVVFSVAATESTVPVIAYVPGLKAQSLAPNTLMCGANLNLCRHVMVPSVVSCLPEEDTGNLRKHVKSLRSIVGAPPSLPGALLRKLKDLSKATDL